MSGLARANHIAGEWRPAASGARSGGNAAADAGWPRSGAEDVDAARRAARGAAARWQELSEGARAERISTLTRALEDDREVREAVAVRFGLASAEVEEHFRGLVRDVRELLALPRAAERGVAWLAHDWSELVRAPLLDLARELAAGRTVVILADERLPELGARLCAAGEAAELPHGVLGVLHGPLPELVDLALSGGAATLVASGRAERTIDLRRACERHGVTDPRLRPLRCGVLEVDPALELEQAASDVVEHAFGRGSTLGGQLPGALGRVFCPARRFSRFSELLLERLAASEPALRVVPQVDAAAAERVRVAWELGLDEGATCIAGGEAPSGSLALPPTVFTNVELFMASAKRQDPMPVLCLLRTS